MAKNTTMPTSNLHVSEKKAIDKGAKAKTAAKEKEKMPGGKAEGLETVSFSQAEKKAIEKGAKIEEEEHGPMAPKEIAKDHVAESGSKYYSDTKGLPAMENKLDKATPAKEPSFSEFEGGRPPAHGTVRGLAPVENLHFSKAHQKLAMQHASAGNKASAMYHQKQAKLYWDAHKGIESKEPAYEIKVKSETLQKPPVSEAQRGAMHAAAAGKSTLDIPKKVGKEFAETDPGGKLPEKAKKSEEDLEKAGRRPQSSWRQKSYRPSFKESWRARHGGWDEPTEAENKRIKDKIKAESAAKQAAEQAEQKAPEGQVTDEKMDKADHATGSRYADRWQAIKGHFAKKPVESIDKALQVGNPITPQPKPTEPIFKSIQYASGFLSKSINSDCDKCGSKQHQQWCDTAKKSESCCKCGTPMSKSGNPEEMPEEIKTLSKAANSVRASEADALKKFDVGGIVDSVKDAFTAPPPANVTDAAPNASASLGGAGSQANVKRFSGIK